MACVLYILEQIRVNYPELSKNMAWFNKFFLRAEEQLKESASVPYAMGLLLTILTFPKHCAIIGIYTLAVADPLAAIIGIRFGKHKILESKSLEGSLAFLMSTLICAGMVFSFHYTGHAVAITGAAIMIALLSTALELLPARVDDNLTIPLFTAMLAWLMSLLFGLPF